MSWSQWKNWQGGTTSQSKPQVQVQVPKASPVRPMAGQAVTAKTVPRPGSAGPALSARGSVAASAAAPVSGSGYTVSCQGEDADDVVGRTLVGDYAEYGSNHNRKYYRKPQGGVDTVEVFLYYWDGRDGPAFKGWWFGNKLGGSQVWSHNTSEAQVPPQSGWKIPWDGAIRPGMQVTPKGQAAGQHSTADRRQVVQEISALGAEAKSATDEAKQLAGDCSDAEGIKAAEELLVPQVNSLNVALKKIMEAQRGAAPVEQKSLSLLGTQIRTLQQTVNAELTKMRSSKKKVEQMASQKEAEENDMNTFAEVWPEAVNRANVAEDAVEKALITAEMISASGEDHDEVKAAVQHTEEAVKEAQKAIGDARIFLNKELAATKRYTSDGARTKAGEQLQKLQADLLEAQKKLTPLKSVRQDFQAKLVNAVLEKLSPAEVEVDKAEQAQVMFVSDMSNKELLKEAETAVNAAGEQLATVLRFIETKRKLAPSEIAKEELTKLEERVKGSQERLNELKGKQKEAQQKVSCEIMLQSAADKLEAVSEAMTKAMESETPFLMGVEDIPLEETIAAIKACETAVQGVTASMSAARMFLATKLVEAKRLQKGLGEDIVSKLNGFQESLGEHTKKVGELKSATAARKQKLLVRQAEQEVVQVEGLVKKVAEAADSFETNEKLFDLSSEQIKSAANATLKGEAEAAAAIAKVKKMLTEKLIEVKGVKDVSTSANTELLKLQTRVQAAQTEVAKWKRLVSTADTRIAAKKVVEEAVKKVDSAEKKIEEHEGLVESLLKDEQQESTEEPETQAENKKPLEEVMKKADQAKLDATAAVKSASRYIEMQVRVATSAKDEVLKLQPRVEKAQERLNKSVEKLKDRSESLIVTELLQESTKKVQEAEESVKKVGEAATPLNKDASELPVEEASKALLDVEAALTAANSAVQGAKTFLAMKRLAARRLGEKAKESSTKAIDELETRNVAATKELAEARKGIAERKMATIKREVVGTVEETEKTVAAAEEATKVLTEKEDSLTNDEMRDGCQKAGKAQTKATTAVADALKLLLVRQRDAKSSSEMKTGFLAEVSALIEKVTKMQAQVEKQRTLLKDQEHRFVANTLKKDFTARLERLEASLKELQTDSVAFSGDNTEAMASLVYLGQVVDAIKKHLKEADKTPQAYFKEMCGDNGLLTEESFVDTVGKLFSNTGGAGEEVLSDEQQRGAFKRLLRGEATECTEAGFLEQFKEKYVVLSSVSMTSSFDLKEGKSVRKLEVNEILEGLEEPKKEDAVGVLRVKAKAEKDGKEGYITFAGNQGTSYLQPYSAFDATVKRLDNQLHTFFTKVKDDIKDLDAKVEELKAVKTGPLNETKAEMLKMKQKFAKVRMSSDDLRKKVSVSQKKLEQAMEAEKKKRQEEVEKKAVATAVKEVDEALKALQADVDKATAAAQATSKPGAAEEDNALKALDDATALIEAAQKLLQETTMPLLEGKLSDTGKNSSRSPEVRKLRDQLVRNKVQVTNTEASLKKQANALRHARRQVATSAHTALVDAIRQHVVKEKIAAEALFKQLCEDAASEDIKVDKLKAFLQGLPEFGLKADKLDIALERYAEGMTKLSMLEMLQDYRRCVKEIAITTAFEVKDSKTLRKILVGEVVEVLEAPQVDKSVGLSRVSCRAVIDGVKGFVTLKGNQGTPFLESTAKPFYCIDKDSGVELQASFESGSEEVGTLKAGEVLELIEGPRKEPNIEVKRVKAKVSKDGKAGWVTVQEGTSPETLETCKLFVCKQSVAVTTAFDITAGKALRKLDVGELFEKLEEDMKDDDKGISRVKVKVQRDGIEGFVTIKGNKGTEYAVLNQNLKTILKSMPLEATMRTGQKVVRELEAGEIIETVGEIQKQIKDGVQRVHGRALSSGLSGWFTLQKGYASKWSPLYECVSSTVLNDGLSSLESKTVRKLLVGEKLQALAVPQRDVGGILRVRVRSERDGKIGFATVRAGATAHLEAVVAGADAGTASASASKEATPAPSAKTASTEASGKAIGKRGQAIAKKGPAPPKGPPPKRLTG
eukprot:TRINITY_DN26314_c0_g1_i2.p1 TRINITY_DN26314_c0_g1~~TRINITY_DN26314_c0_g1_i2.p1  ORF type:complete len:2040 (+),score=823.72 TRINITY_DN26314_c0_g1_i2:119-6238(+)